MTFLRRRRLFPLVASGAVVILSACKQDSGPPAAGAPSAQPQDVKSLAGALQVKTVAMIDAMNARNDARISSAKTDLEREANRVEDALKSETGQAANRTNAAVGRIKNALIANDVRLLEQARDLLQQAQQN